ncbi:MAG: hypothetical protein SFU56_04795 [Capsulimonadales bacterium]|nr:hypothetical protein [Capsulimonadales bacterium]
MTPTRFFGLRNFGAVAAGLLSMCVVGVPCRAQDAPESAPPTTTAPTATTSTLAITGTAPVQADLTLLARAMRALSETASFSYEGDIEIKGVGRGLTFAGRERVRFSAKRPGKVRSDILMTLGDAPKGKRYITVSDGTEVWVHRPGTREFTRAPLDPAEFTRNLTGFGILGALYFNRNLLSGVGLITTENAAQFTELLKKENIDLSGTYETVDDTEMPVFVMALSRQKMTFRFFVDPKRAVLRRLEVTAHEKNMDFTMTETVVRQNAAPLLPKGEFKFVPPPGHRKTARIAIELL